ncbi:uncharacterized protein LOC143960941 [Lithobates pipiens]
MQWAGPCIAKSWMKTFFPSAKILKMGCGWVFQHDNDPKHTTKITKESRYTMSKKKTTDKEHSSEATDNENDENKCCNCCCAMERFWELFSCATDLAEAAGVEIPEELETVKGVAEAAQEVLEELPVDDILDATSDFIKEQQKTKANNKKQQSDNPKQSKQ